ncbi:MAG: hypothetical protein LBU56_00790 [Rickettsiales bacterium]|jgi:hypothetical protein|nr:hypothetical protein [Rickettsiales bacterium]
MLILPHLFEILNRFLGKSKPVSEERKKDLIEKLKYAAREFDKAGTRSDHQAVPKEQQFSIDLGNKKIFVVVNKVLNWLENTFKHLFPRYDYSSEIGTKERFLEVMQGLSISLQKSRRSTLKLLTKEDCMQT